MEDILLSIIGFAIIIFVIAIILYIVQAIFLNRFNKLVYGKGTALAWIPICNIYLLGKLTFNKTIGWILVICSILSSSFKITINGVTTTHSILPEDLSDMLSLVYSIAVIGLFVYAIVKYIRLKNNSSNSNYQSM